MLNRFVLLLLIFPLFIFCEEKRLALVIGNANYDEGKLKNPVNDALLIKTSLEQLDFDVILDTNINDVRSFKQTIRKFGKEREDYDVALVYYAGHGIQVGFQNYLLPTKEIFETEDDVIHFGINVEEIMRHLNNQTDQINILILDACRNNPFENKWNTTRSITNGAGLAAIKPISGSLIAFSTDPGRVAMDGKGKNSVYAQSLARNIVKPNISIHQVFSNVRSEVEDITNNYQSPVEQNKLRGDVQFMFNEIKDSLGVNFNSKEIFTMFYNVENLFDTIDDPKTNDNEFLPESKKAWNTEKYNHKLNNLSKVISDINEGRYPDIIGLAEVENKQVICDLLKTDFLKFNQYKIVHKDSPDSRGIDCALLIDTSKYQIINYDFIEINLPENEYGYSSPTRDIIYAKIKIEDIFLNIFVNHWSSRWGGQEATNYKRVFIANTLLNYIENNIEQNENIIILGDLNDYSHNESLQVLEQSKFNIINLMQQLENKQQGKKGSYKWDGKWAYLDHILVSSNLYYMDQTRLILRDYNVFSREYMLYTKANGETAPCRNFGGDNWYKGYSDHLPVYCKFQLFNCVND